MRPGALVGLLAVSILLPACPRRVPTDPDPEPEPTPRLPELTVATTSGQLQAGLYPGLRGAPAAGLPLAELRALHDTARYEGQIVRWAEDLPVLEFIDRDRRSTGRGAVAGWFLDVAPVAPRGPGDAQPPPRVLAALLRDFEDAPVGGDVPALLAGLAEAFPPAWDLCQLSVGDRLVTLAYDASRGIKLAFDRNERQDTWTLDHVEYTPAAADQLVWWSRKGYTDCRPLGRIDEDGMIRLEPAPEGGAP